jgi:phospholipid/cholesterol/gamma-HCH transport system permease protein
VCVGLFKAVIFALIISTVACAKGVRVSGGSREVAAATTSAVVSSLVWMIVANALITVVLFYLP